MREAIDTIAKPQAGMTLLDYYIGQALQGLLASPGTGREIECLIRSEGWRVEKALGLVGTSAVKYAMSTLTARDELVEKLKTEARTPQPRGESDADG